MAVDNIPSWPESDRFALWYVRDKSKNRQWESNDNIEEPKGKKFEETILTQRRVVWEVFV